MLRALRVAAPLSARPVAARQTSARLAALAAVRYASSKPASAEQDSFVRGLFLGQLRSEQLFPYPDVLTADQKETVSDFVKPITDFMENRNNPYKNDVDASIPEDIIQGIKELGLYGIQVPAELNGLGLNNTGYARLAEIVASHDLGISITIGAHQSIGFKGILIAGNEEQKKKYLPKLATGEYVAAFALTEPTSGSDANSIRTKATLSADGKHFILNGNKLWISNGGTAHIFTVFAQTEVLDKDGKKTNKVTAFIVERAFGGITHSEPENKMGIKCSNTAAVYFDNCKVPVENVIGEVGGGFKVAMNILNNGRFGMSAGLTGVMKKMVIAATAHANQRVQFGHPIRNYGLIKKKIADMALKVYATESMAYLLSSNMDLGKTDYQLEAAISKVFASENAWNVCDETIQILGGMGFMKETQVERVLRDLRIFRIFEGSNEILRLFVALTGIQATGIKLKGLQKALANPLSNLGVITAEGSKRIGKMLGSSGSLDLKGAHPSLGDAKKLIETNAVKFSDAVEAALIKHGKNIVERQFVLERIANSAIDLFAMAAVVSRASRTLERKSEHAAHEALLATTYCRQADVRLAGYFAGLKNPSVDDGITEIADAVLDNGAVVPTHPLGF